MKKIFVLSAVLLFSVSLYAQKNIYGFTVKDINGKPFALSQLKGKKVLIVNVASKCGFTPQYKALEALYKKYESDGFVIIGFPANNFAHQEPGSNAEIKKFCTLNYNVTFPMMSKISVKGDDMAPLYRWLTEKKLNGKENSEVKWNFQKYLINRDGTLSRVYNPWVKPDNKKIIEWIKSK
ncbi:MAG: glutathione peroxidase [Bacteroidales bacterium]|nr:glutathione peroxidase [Bacteroidales bacterium]